MYQFGAVATFVRVIHALVLPTGKGLVVGWLDERVQPDAASS
jgi:hypothetical protein